MSLTDQDWHRRFRQQAQWTAGLRDQLFSQIPLSPQSRVLDVGCGTGALMEDLIAWTEGVIVGLDLDHARLIMAMRNYPRGRFLGGDGHALPFPTGTFEVSLSHYLFLWLRDPLQGLREMKRVTVPGGYVLTLAEPDYGGRIDYPPPLKPIKEHQIRSLQKQGADPRLGRKLRQLYEKAGLRDVTYGVYAGQWQAPSSEEGWELEWEILKEDLKSELDPPALEELQEAEKRARVERARVLYLPTFYAWGRV